MPPARRIDVHGHLLPGLDDGSRTLDESVQIARRMADAGYSHLTCSPHIWPGHSFTPAFILDRVAKLQRELNFAKVPITLVAGGEINLLDLDVFSIPDDEIPTYGMANRYVLFDFWDDELPHDYWARVDRVRVNGAIAIQAHPERIAAFQLDPALLDELAARGVLLQCNLQCLTETAGRRARERCLQWLDERRYFMFGSDLHRIDTLEIRLHGLEIARELLGNQELDRLTIENPARVIGLPGPVSAS